MLQPAAGDLEQLLGIALGTEQADGQTGRLVIPVFKGQLEALHAAVPPGQKGLQVQQQAADGKQQSLVGVDLEVELDAGNKLVRRLVTAQRHRQHAEQPVEMGQHLGGEASGQGIPWQAEYLPQLLEPHARQCGHALGIQAAALDRQALDMLAQGQAVHDRQPVVHIGQRPGGGGVGGQHYAVLKAQPGQILPQALLEARPGAEQAQAGFDLQQQCMGIIQTDMGAVAVGPGGEKVLPVADLLFIVFGHGKVGDQGLGGGQAHARPQAQGPGLGIDCPDQAARHMPGYQHQGRIGVIPPALHPIQGQPGQQYAGPAHGG